MLEYRSIRKRRCSRGSAAAALPGSARTEAVVATGTASVGPAGLAIDLGLYLARPSHGCALDRSAVRETATNALCAARFHPERPPRTMEFRMEGRCHSWLGSSSG